MLETKHDEALPVDGFTGTLEVFLLRSGWVSHEQLEVARQELALKGGSLSEILVTLSILDEDKLACAQSACSHWPLLHEDEAVLWGGEIDVLPWSVLVESHAMPWMLSDTHVSFAIADALNVSAIQRLRALARPDQTVSFFITTFSRVKTFHQNYGQIFSLAVNEEDKSSALSLLTRPSDFIEGTLNQALSQQASDIHFPWAGYKPSPLGGIALAVRSD